MTRMDLDDIEKLINLKDFELLCRDLLTSSALAYLETGAGDGSTVLANELYWQSLKLIPRVLKGIESVDTSTDLLGMKLNHPILLAPVASHSTFHESGELESMKGARESETTFIFSSHSSLSLRDIPIPPESNWWFQIYLHRDRDVSYELADLAISKGAKALVLTVDTPIAGYRDLDRRTFPESGPRLTPGQPESAYPNLSKLKRFEDNLPRHRKVLDPVLDPNVSWRDVEILLAKYKLPVILKGILHPLDARKAFEIGVSAIVASNHGGRNLDGAISAAESIRNIRRVVGESPIVLLDGGIRRGSDVLKAIALGANSVLIGRPYIWGLSIFGASGVSRIVEMLRTELEISMILCGVSKLEEVNSELLVAHSSI